MKKLLLLTIPAAMFFSCNTEMPADQYRTQAQSQCMSQLVGRYMEDTATDAQKEAFCDCYADYMVGDAETVSVGEMMKKATKMEELTAAFEACEAQVTESEAPDTHDVDMASPEELKTVEELEENAGH